jgi:hypothetical protein
MEEKLEKLAVKAVTIASNQMDDCDKIRQPRLIIISEMMDAYYGKNRPSLLGRSNIPIPFFAKYIDEIKSRIDESPTIKFKHTKNSQILLARKVQAATDRDRSPSQGDWNRKDRMSKIMALFSGVGVYDKFSESAPDYESYLEPVDIFDFWFEATGGSDLEDHAFVGKGPFFRTKDELETMVENGVYDKKMVDDLLNSGGSSEYKEDLQKYISKYQRARALGMDLDGTFIGQEVFPCMNWQMTIGGQRYFLTFEAISKKPLRFKKLKDVYGSNLYSLVMWQTHEDPHLVLSKSPADDIWPIAEWLRVQANYLMDSQTKKLWGQRAYDPDFFPDPSQLIWSRPDQLIQAKSYGGKPISQGVYEFRTDDNVTATVDLLEYFENFMASVAGVSPAEGGSNEDQKVGIMFGNLQKVSSRLGVYNKSYNECWNKIAVRQVWGLKEHLSEPMMVKIIGESGVEWDDLKKEELTSKTEFDIEVVGSNVELEMSEAKKTKQMNSLDSISKDPEQMKQVNPKFLVEEKLRVNGFSEDSIKRAMNVDNMGSEKSISHAAMGIEKILRGKKVKPYRGADIAFLQYINDFAADNDLDDQKAVDIINYGREHLKIVVKNMALKASLQLSSKGITPDQMQAKPAGPRRPTGFVPPTPAQAPPVATGQPNAQ